MLFDAAHIDHREFNVADPLLSFYWLLTTVYCLLSTAFLALLFIPPSFILEAFKSQENIEWYN